MADLEEKPPLPLETASDPNAATPSVPSAINMPDHAVRQAKWYQIYVRLARPSLDWATLGWFVWCTILEPVIKNRFDSTAVPMCLVWCATVYGFRYAEKIKGVA
jgi:hypothetical protein